MKKYTTLALLLVFAFALKVEAGNPDRTGQAGAYELLLNPWARSSGWHTIGTANIRGVESLRLNPAGLSFTRKTELVFARTNYLQGTDVYFNSVGISQRMHKNGVLGISLMSIDFGDIAITTTDQPEGIGADYSPAFYNLGVSYGHSFGEKIAIGATVRIISQQITNVSASGVAFDFGIQYQTGENNEFKLGIALRNVGSPMRFGGDGLSFAGASATGTSPFTVENRPADYELPSQLNIGASYDFLFADKNRVTLAGNFTSNSFTKDQFGAGVEYAFSEKFMVRGGYKYEAGITSEADRSNVHTGLSAGATVEVPVKKNSKTSLGVDYSYRTSNPFGGTHTFGLRIAL